jgi:predicted Zn-ribbon and HTH transcriptional regulator
MKHDENRYPTMKFLRCRKCGNVFVGSLTGAVDCPDCSSEDTQAYTPDMDQDTDQTG